MKKEISRKSKKFAMVTIAGIMALNMVTVPVVSTDAATEHWNDASAEWTAYKKQWDNFSTDYENVSLTPGKSEKELNLAWYSHTEEVPKVKFASNKEMKDAQEFSGVQKNINDTVEGYFSNKVTVTGLEENKQYFYQVMKNGEWGEVKNYSTGSFSDYSILYVGDPQIGACTKQVAAEGDTMSENAQNLAARNDSFNWNKVLTQATALHDVSFMISAGDQVNTANKEEEYAGYLSANALSSLPVATTIGNHDSKSEQYTYHYNNPNTFDKENEAQKDYTEGATVAGTDYYYTYGDVLFIVLDTNNYNCATHENVIKKAVEENKDAKWRIVTFHQDIYGSGYDHSDSDGIVLRTQLTPLLDKYNIDVVLQGHDHTYSRTYQLTSDGKDHEKYSKSPISASTPSDNSAKVEYLKQNNCYNIIDKAQGTAINPKGTVYFEANSATGSKFYNLIATQQDYIAERGQSWTPNYSVINVSENAITVTTYDAATGAKLDNSSSYTIVKEADKMSLKSEIEKAEEYAKQTDKYTADSIYELKDGIRQAKEVLNNSKATSVEVSKAAGTISKAIAGLKIAEKAANIDSGNVKDNTQNAVNKDTNAQASDKNNVKPKSVKIKSVKYAKGKKLTVSWKKQSNVTGYQIKIATDKKFKKNVKTLNISKKTKATFSKVKASKKYFAKVRAYIMTDGKKIYGAYGSTKTVRSK